MSQNKRYKNPPNPKVALANWSNIQDSSVTKLVFCIYGKNVLLILLVFTLNHLPQSSSVIVFLFQQTVALVIFFCSRLQNRRLWVLICQEVLLCFYFASFVKYQSNTDVWMSQTVLDIMYFIGMSFGIFGILFEIVDRKKKILIPKEAWSK